MASAFGVVIMSL